jgi:trimeric autotransporter adhesin
MMLRKRAVWIVGGLAVCLASAPVGAVVTPDRSSPVAQKEFRHPNLYIPGAIQRADAVAQGARLAADLGSLGVSAQNAHLDLRSGRFATLLGAQPLVPGTGVGNSLSWESMGLGKPANDAAWGEAAWKALVGYLEAHSAQLAVDDREFARPGIGVHDGGNVIQFYVPRSINGIPVRESYLTAVVNHGNLVLLGAHQWGSIAISTSPTVREAQAVQTLVNHVAPLAPTGYRGKAKLAILPLATGAFDAATRLGKGYDYRLVWVLSPRFSAEIGNWEAVVDAGNGELISFLDTNQYQSARKVVGGVYPVSNDGAPPDGVEQPGTPMPFVDVTAGPDTFTTDTGGNVGVCVNGDISTALSGRFIKMTDTCGAAAETSPGDIDLSQGAGTDCVVPAGHSVGDTHASRTGFYELNKLKEQARGQLPNNTWLQTQLNANMNLNQTCNAFWDGGSVNFFKSGGGCNNTGEIAAIFDHEWSHGLDNNDVTGTIANPGEATADIYMALRLKTSCVGRNFFQTGQCGGYGDPCVTGCDGVRDMDFANHQSGLPHDLTWVGTHCGTGGGGPCNGEVHCEGTIPGEVLWDFFNRDLPSDLGMSTDTALEVAVRDAYIGMGVIGNWYTCSQGSGGCPANSGYMNFLAADDDNGSITDGTPHMQAIFDSFDRHGVGCTTPTPQNTGCAGSPSVAPNVAGVAQDRGATLSWNSVSGAVKYRVYRTEGPLGCNFGKVLLGETFGTSFADSGLQNGRV